MRVQEVMTRSVECVTPSTSLRDAASKMKALDVGPMPVCDNDRLAGMLTDRDIAIRAVAEGLDPQTTKVKDVMTPDVIWCYEDQDVKDAARMMEEHQIRRLLVLDRNKRLVGIVAMADLAVDTGDRRLVGETLEAVSQPGTPQR
jgi:CBS domain-containing protein